MRRPVALIALIAAFALAGCGQGGGGPAPSPSASPQPSPTTSPQPTPTTSPVPTTPGPDVTPHPSPTSSPVVSPTPAPTATVIASRTTHDWGRPLEGSPYVTEHTAAQPPTPCLVSVATGNHPEGDPEYDQISFRFDTAFPSYEVEYVSSLVHEGSGEPVAVPEADSILRVVFRQAQAHKEDGSSCITSAPPTLLDLLGIRSWVPAGDFEGVLVYGLGVARATDGEDPHPRVRVVEVERAEPGGTVHVVAIQVATPHYK